MIVVQSIPEFNRPKDTEGTMARYSEQDIIYKAAQTFRDNCLQSDGSLVFHGAALWKTDLLARIHKAFVATPDEGDRSFIDKFRDQSNQLGRK